MKNITKEDVNYISHIFKLLLETLQEVQKEQQEEHYLYQSNNRARFNRLRLEINKTLIDLERKMYG